MKRYLSYALVALVAFFSLSVQAQQKEEEVRSVTEAYFFALDHGNYEGAYSLHGAAFKKRMGSLETFTAGIQNNTPFLVLHKARSIVKAEVEPSGQAAKVSSIFIGPDNTAWGVMLSLEIEDGLWRIVGGSLIRLGTARPEM